MATSDSRACRRNSIRCKATGVTRVLHDLGLAVWCGGSLMGATSLNTSVTEISDPTIRSRVVNDGWKTWAPFNAAAIGAHLLGGALILRENRGRIAGQQGVAAWTGSKVALTAAAVASTALTGRYAAAVWAQDHAPIQDGTTPEAGTPGAVAAAQQRLKVLQWATPALTAALIVASARMGEQQRPTEVVKGMLGRGAQAARHPSAVISAVRSAD